MDENTFVGEAMISHVSLKRIADAIKKKHKTDNAVSVELYLTPIENNKNTIGFKI